MELIIIGFIFGLATGVVIGKVIERQDWIALFK